MFVTIVDNPFHKKILGYIVKHTHTRNFRVVSLGDPGLAVVAWIHRSRPLWTACL